MIKIGYTTTKDYSNLNPPKFVDIKKIYNTILIPQSEIDQNLSPADTASIIINNKTIKQKAGINSGLIEFYGKSYYFFHIIPGFTADSISQHKYEILISNKKIKLQTTFDSTYTAKIINGLIVLPNNFNYMFNHNKYCIITANNKNILTHILKYDNKYSYYTANTNNSILSILSDININTLYEINNTYNDIYIRPLFNKNYPLGSCSICAGGVKDINVRIGNNIFKFSDKINIDYLPSGNYRVDFLDNSGNIIIIDSVNDEYWNKDFIEINIEQSAKDTGPKSEFLGFNNTEPPLNNYANLLVNIFPYNTPFELFGPNNFYKKFTTGYQKIKNIIPGQYSIKYKNKNANILMIKNDNNYFSNI